MTDQLRLSIPKGADEADTISQAKALAERTADQALKDKIAADKEKLAAMKKEAAVASGATPPQNPAFVGNKTFGRIKTMQCSRTDPDFKDPKSGDKVRLAEQSQRYAEHASGQAPLSPRESVELRADIDRLSQRVNPGSSNAWPDYSPAEKSYLAGQAEEKRHFANSLGIWGGGSVYAALPAAARILRAPEDVVEDFAEINANVAGVFGPSGGSGKATGMARSRTGRGAGRGTPKKTGPGDGVYVEKLPPKNPTAYSVSYEMKLQPADLGRSRSVQFNRANKALDASLKSDTEFASMMDDLIPGAQDSVSSIGGRATPDGWIWEHASSSTASGETGVMRLVPEAQHTPGSPWWRVLHPDPGAAGGYSEWAIPNGAPKN